MSTNYYIVPTEVIDANVSLNWVKKVHIAQNTRGGVLLQAVVGETAVKNFAYADATVLYHTDVEGFPTLESWADIRDVVLNPYYTVIDEYDTVVQKNHFVNMVEQNENSIGARYEETVRFRENYAHLALGENYVVLDAEGYAVDYREFF